MNLGSKQVMWCLRAVIIFQNSTESSLKDEREKKPNWKCNEQQKVVQCL